MQRRTLFKLGLAGTALLVLGGGMLALVRPGWKDGAFTPAGRELFAALARAILHGTLPAPDDASHARAIEGHLGRVQAAINGLPPASQAELNELMALLLHPAGRRALVGLANDWPVAPRQEVHDALQGLRLSSLATKQQIFQGLRELTVASYYGDASTWQAIGYTGQRPV
jgi:hypothetical protein